MNHKINGAKKGNTKKKKKEIEFDFCKACNRNHDEGQRHKYLPNHKKFLSNYLSRFQTKLDDVRFFLKNPRLLSADLASRNLFWCVFCDGDVDEIGSSFACGNAIKHLASDNHLKNLKHFMWKYGGGMDHLDTFRVLEADFSKWEKKCEALKNEVASSSDGSRGQQIGPVNDIHNELKNENINNFEKNAFDPLKSNLSNGVMPLQYYTNEYQISYSGLSAVTNVGPFAHDAITSSSSNACSSTSLWNSKDLKGNWSGQHYLPNNTITHLNNHSSGVVSQRKRMPKEVKCSQGLHLTQISTMDADNAGGNVHTGAPPPWFQATEDNGPNVLLNNNLILSSFIQLSNKSEKSHKLNPKRVGAAWAEKRKIEQEMEKRGEILKSDCDANWLPNFGRVWQSGSRKESRKEFEKEKQQLPKVERHSETPISVQPYISKRMRKDANE